MKEQGLQRLQLKFTGPRVPWFNDPLTPDTTTRFCRLVYADLDDDAEWLVIVPLDSRDRPLGYRAVGGVSSMTVMCEFPIIARTVIMAGASRYVLIHNHPSGNQAPSKSDIEFTHHLKQTSRWLDLQLVFHGVFAWPNRLSIVPDPKEK